MTESDKVNPAHYKTPAGIESIDVIEAFGLGFHLGNVAKYILRAGKKGTRHDMLTDLCKARWYINREIDIIQADMAQECDDNLRV